MLLGKVLRLNPDGSMPDDNPFLDKTRGKYRGIWALGCRNPFSFAVQPETGRIFLNDVGGVREEINEGFPGANYGWPVVEHGPTADPRFRGPIHHYPTSSITGGTFCPRAAVAGGFPEKYRGKYFFMDFMKGWIHVLDPERPSHVDEFASKVPRAVDLRFAKEGSLYLLTRNMWVKDKDFKPGTGALWQIRYDPTAVVARPVKKPVSVASPSPILPDGGTYTGPITVRLEFGGRGAEIRYTTDGSEPSREAKLYEHPFRVTEDSVVKARDSGMASRSDASRRRPIASRAGDRMGWRCDRRCGA